LVVREEEEEGFGLCSLLFRFGAAFFKKGSAGTLDGISPQIFFIIVKADDLFSSLFERTLKAEDFYRARTRGKFPCLGTCALMDTLTMTTSQGRGQNKSPTVSVGVTTTTLGVA
jgi:hypothetical protein